MQPTGFTIFSAGQEVKPKIQQHNCQNLTSRNPFAVCSMKFKVGQDLDDDSVAPRTVQFVEPTAVTVPRHNTAHSRISSFHRI